MSTAATDTALPLSRTQAVTGGFVLFNVVAIILWAVPLPHKLVAGPRDGVTGYMVASGLHQSWAMFAPEPTSLNAFVEAEVTHRDGRVTTWRFPSTAGLGYYRKYLMERYRKWANDHVRVDDDAVIWPDAARYVAWVNRDPVNPPTHIRLVRYWWTVEPPSASAVPPLEPWHRYPYFDYDVVAADLQ